MNKTLRLSTSPRGRRFVLAAWVATHFASPLSAADVVPAPGYTKLSQPRPEIPSEAKDEADPDAATVRLNVFNMTWPDILEKVAEQSGSTLVLHDPPPGRWTRADYRAYSRTEAVTILNRELEPKGFRILENGDHLIVLSERTMRKQYRPAVVVQEDELGRPVAPASEPLPTPRGYRRQFDAVRPAAAEESALEETSARPRPLAGPHPFDAPAAGEPRRAAPRPDGPPVTVSVRVGRGSAAAVARKVHDAFGAQSELADAGPTGLPAFRVHSRDLAGQGREVRQVAFEVEIDTAGDELLVTAPRNRASAVAELLRDLDRNAADPDARIRIAPASEEQLHIAGQIAPVLAQVAQEGPGNAGQPANPQTPPVDGQNNDDRNQGNRNRPGGADDLPALIGNLRGEVGVEAVPDLGVLILRGNDQDVQAVLDVIRTLENLSAGQQPVIELLRLEHVDSTALSELLTTLYTQLARVRNRGEEAPTRIAVLPLVRPNAVLIVAPEGEIDSVLDLASELDQPVDPTTQFQVFPLKSASAEFAAATITQFYTDPTGLQARVTVTADIRTNSLIVSARPRDMNEVAALVRRIDTNESGAVSRMKVFPLKSAAAEELAEVITTAIQSVINPAAAQTQTQNLNAGAAGGGEAAQQLRAARSAVLEFLDASGDAPQLLRSGLLADVRVTSDPRTNSLLVSAGEQSLPLIEALIRQLDRPAAAVSEIKVFSLENSDAASVVELLDTLFATDAAADDNATPGIQLAGATGAGSSLIPLRFATDVRTNSVIATGSGDALRVVEAILLRLDESDVRNRETTVVKLKNAPAEQVATALQNLLTSQRELITIDEDLVSNTELLEREIIVVPEPVSNSLIISATPRFFEEITRIVAKLDEAPPQVIIQAMLVEVDLDNADEFGIELGLQDSTLFDRSATVIDQLLTTTTTAPNGTQTSSQQIISQSGTPGFNFNNQPLGNNTASGPGSIGTQGLSNFSLGRTNADLGYGGFVFSASSANVSVLLRALSAKRTIHVLSRPQIRTLDNQEAQIQVGQNVPVINGFTQNGLAGSVVPTVIRDDAGLILTVIPRISPDGNIVMVVAAERSEYTGAGVPIFTDPTNGTSIEAPIKDVTSATATVSVPTGQTIVLGGIITRSDDTLERKVPYLGDIPYLGALFRYDSTRTRRRELLIFLTPRVIFNDSDSELIKQVEADRLHFIEHEAESIHGPLYSVPPAGPVGPQFDVPPVMGPESFPGATLPPGAVPPGTEVLPGLPAEACPPGVYPPGTMFEDGPPLPADGPSYPLPPGAAPQGVTPMGGFPPAAPPAEGAILSTRPTGHASATGRLAGRTQAVNPAPKKKKLLPSFGKR